MTTRDFENAKERLFNISNTVFPCCRKAGNKNPFSAQELAGITDFSEAYYNNGTTNTAARGTALPLNRSNSR